MYRILRNIGSLLHAFTIGFEHFLGCDIAWANANANAMSQANRCVSIAGLEPAHLYQYMYIIYVYIYMCL
jgi:hypothetical protein